MNEKMFNTRIVHKHDIEANWEKAVNFCPKAGELIIYDVDDSHSSSRIKIGDGIRTVGDLPFVDGVGKETSGLTYQIYDEDFKAESGAEIFNDYSTNVAIGQNSTARGFNTMAIGNCSYAEGAGTAVWGDYGHAEGCHEVEDKNEWSLHFSGEKGTDTYSFTCMGLMGEEYSTLYSLIPGFSSIEYEEKRGKVVSIDYENKIVVLDKTINEDYSLDGDLVRAINPYNNLGFGSHTEGYGAITWPTFKKDGGSDVTIGFAAHAEGERTISVGSCSHSEGVKTVAVGQQSHAEGHRTIAFGSNSHAEGVGNKAMGSASHVEGSQTVAIGSCSHAEGFQTRAIGDYSHASGYHVVANGESQFVYGRYNEPDGEDKYVHITGNGKSNRPSNAHTLDWEGNAWFSGDVYVGSKSGINRDEGSKKLLTMEDNLISVEDIDFICGV